MADFIFVGIGLLVAGVIVGAAVHWAR